MLSDKDDFSEEYVPASGTQSPPPEELSDLGKKETESGGPKYGLSKPQRHKIRGKITHDQG